MDEKPLVTIIVPFTYPDKELLGCLRGIEALNYNSWELILVSDDKQEIPKIRNSKVLVAGDRNIGYKRNLGIKASDPETRYYAFIDSDAYPRKDWLLKALNILEETPGAGAVGGPEFLPPDSSWREVCASKVLLSPLISVDTFLASKYRGIKKVEKLPSCNLVVRKSMVKETGTFNENMITGEDHEYCERIKKSGYDIFYSEEVVVYHHRRKLWISFLRQRFIYGGCVLQFLRQGLNRSNFFFLLPVFFGVAFILFIITGFLGFPQIRYALNLIFIPLIIIFAIETLRVSKKVSHIPATFFAIALAFGLQIAGAAASFFRVLDFRKMYKSR